jgi:sugar/nucleoside kinase (ribokinase family)
MEVPPPSARRGGPSMVVLGCLFIDEKVRPPGGVWPAGSGSYLGGIGANVARQLALLGWDTGLVTLFEPGQVGQCFQEWLRAAGVRLAVKGVPRGIGRCRMVLDGEGHLRELEAWQPAIEELDWPFLRRREAWLRGAKSLVLELGLDLECVRNAISSARRAGARVCGLPTRLRDVGPRWDVLASLDCLLLNRFEASFLLDRPVDDVRQGLDAARKLASQGIPRVVLTLGTAGVVAWDEGREVVRSALRPAVVADEIGAGDALAAAVASSLAAGRSLGAGLDEGLVLAARAVEDPGTLLETSALQPPPVQV